MSGLEKDLADAQNTIAEQKEELRGKDDAIVKIQTRCKQMNKDSTAALTFLKKTAILNADDANLIGIRLKSWVDKLDTFLEPYKVALDYSKNTYKTYKAWLSPWCVELDRLEKTEVTSIDIMNYVTSTVTPHTETVVRLTRHIVIFMN